MSEQERLSEGLFVRRRRCRICSAKADGRFTVILRTSRLRRRYVRTCPNHGAQLGSAIAAVSSILREQRLLQQAEAHYHRGNHAD